VGIRVEGDADRRRPVDFVDFEGGIEPVRPWALDDARNDPLGGNRTGSGVSPLSGSCRRSLSSRREFRLHNLSAIDSGLGPSPSLGVSGPTFQVGHVDPGRSLMYECCDCRLRVNARRAESAGMRRNQTITEAGNLPGRTDLVRCMVQLRSIICRGPAGRGCIGSPRRASR
jgi:hypothetical protein